MNSGLTKERRKSSFRGCGGIIHFEASDDAKSGLSRREADRMSVSGSETVELNWGYLPPHPRSWDCMSGVLR